MLEWEAKRSGEQRRKETKAVQLLAQLKEHPLARSRGVAGVHRRGCA